MTPHVALGTCTPSLGLSFSTCTWSGVRFHDLPGPFSSNMLIFMTSEGAGAGPLSQTRDRLCQGSAEKCHLGRGGQNESTVLRRGVLAIGACCCLQNLWAQTAAAAPPSPEGPFLQAGIHLRPGWSVAPQEGSPAGPPPPLHPPANTEHQAISPGI